MAGDARSYAQAVQQADRDLAVLGNLHRLSWSLNLVTGVVDYKCSCAPSLIRTVRELDGHVLWVNQTNRGPKRR